MESSAATSTSPLRLLSVHAHPDDESSKGAATLAHYVAEGVAVVVVSCTGGERGALLNQSLLESAPHEAAMAERDLGGLRRIEMERARSIIGYEHRWLGFEDSGMPDDGVALPPTVSRSSRSRPPRSRSCASSASFAPRW